MTGYPTLGFALLQGLITAVVMLAPPLLYAFAGKLKTTLLDAFLILCTFPALMIVTTVVFYPFEGDWAGFGAAEPLRTPLVGGLALFIGMAFTQRRKLVRRGASEAAVRLGAAFLIGAVWGLVWGLTGWGLEHMGMPGNG